MANVKAAVAVVAGGGLVGRLKEELLLLVEAFSHRMVDVAETVANQDRSPRIVEQMMGAGTSVGANIWEACEALSRADFCKTIGIAVKELSESRFWIRFVTERGWIERGRLSSLDSEATELIRVLGAIIHRTRRTV